MKKLVSELEGPELDYWVARAEGFDGTFFEVKPYSSEWAHGGPIIDRERITLHAGQDRWGAWISQALLDPQSWSMTIAEGTVALEAAMRCRVAKAFGAAVDISVDDMIKK